MQTNVGYPDRLVRAVAGLLLLCTTALTDASISWWTLVSLIPLATAIFGWCPVYVLLGINTDDYRAGPISR